MNNVLLTLLWTVTLLTTAAAKDDVPSGYVPLAKLADAQAKAKASKKLVAVTAKGNDDQCPHCASAFAQGTSALRSDCVMVFTRVSDLRAQRETLPPALKDASASAADGAAVAFYVFDPDLKELVTTTDRAKIQADPKSLKEVKKAVHDAQKKLSASGSSSSGLDALKKR